MHILHPTLIAFSLNGREITIGSYTFFIVLAAVATVLVGAFTARKRDLDYRKSLACLLIGLVVSIIGARLVHWLTNPGSFEGGVSVFSTGRSNLSAYAGLLFGVPAAAISARNFKLNPSRLADSVAPALGLGIAIARVGCLLNGCCYGQPTHALWGIVCPVGSDAHADQILSGAIGLFDAPLPVHPTQAYEVIAAILGGLIALLLLRRNLKDGKAFLAFVLWFTAFRWVNTIFLSKSASFSAPVWLYPAIYAVVIGLCLARIVRRRG